MRIRLRPRLVRLLKHVKATVVDEFFGSLRLSVASTAETPPRIASWLVILPKAWS